MNELTLEGVADGPLYGVNALIGGGCSVVLGSDPVALGTLIAIGAGARAPRRGRALFDGALLHASPELRRTTGALLAEEPILTLGRVSDVVGMILAARSEARAPHALLEEVGLAAWGARRPSDLDASERRTLLCALALAHPSPRLLALYEPLAAGRGLHAAFVTDALERAKRAGAVVLCATQSIDDARSLGGVPFLLGPGSLANVSTMPLGAPNGGESTFVLETPDARRLTAALARDPAVLGVRWNEEQAPDTLLVFGSDTERLAMTITRVASEESASVRSLKLAPAPLQALLASRAHAFQAPPVSPYGAPPVASPDPAQFVPHPALPPTAPAPPDQSVAMPTSFADPTRPPFGSGS